MNKAVTVASVRQLPYDAVAYVNATKEEPRLPRGETKLPRKKRRTFKKANPEKTEKSLFDPGRHFPVPY